MDCCDQTKPVRKKERSDEEVRALRSTALSVSSTAWGT